jgi:aminopeptidase N
MAEFDFGVERVINFKADRKQSERTYLLKAVAGCPNQPEKIIKLLNMTMLEDDEKLTENDLCLILSMLSGGSTGYGTLIKFLDQNWSAIKTK